jgi:chemotaxis signal transduction protein
VVISVNDLEVAFLADVVDGVQTVFENELEPPLAAPFTRGIAPGMTAVLDLHTLFNRERLIINEETM